MTGTAGAARQIPAAARIGYGLFLLVAPERLLSLGSGAMPGWAPPIARLLGARHVLQGVVLTAHPQLAGPGAFVDMTHVATDVLCAALSTDLRNPPLIDAGVGIVLASASLILRTEGSSP